MGKSYSMVFFSRKVLRKIRGNWTFVVVTDRTELDDQLYRTFAKTGALTREKVQAESGEHLKELLREENRYRNCQSGSVEVGTDKSEERGVELEKEALIGASFEMLNTDAL